MNTLTNTVNDTLSTLHAIGSAAGDPALSWDPWMTNVVVALVLAYVGYLMGSWKFFKEQQLRVYEEVLPMVLKTLYSSEKKDEKEFNAGIAKAWIYFSREVALKLETVLSIIVQPKRVKTHCEIKDLVFEMRKDVQPLIRCRKRKLDGNEIAHLYTTLVDRQKVNRAPCAPGLFCAQCHTKLKKLFDTVG